MSTELEGLRPEDFAEAATAAIADATDRDIEAAAGVFAEAGLLGIYGDEGDGGLGLGLDFALSVVAIAGKETFFDFPLIEQILLARAFAGTPQAEALIAGQTVATVAWQGTLESGHAAQARLAPKSGAVLVATAEGAALLDLASLGVTEDPSLDPDRPQSWLALDGAAVIATLDADRFADLRRDATMLYGAYVTGLAEAALQTTVAYLSTRTQFGRPLSAKQSVRHSLARLKLLIEKNKAALARCLSPDEFGGPRDPEATFVTALADAVFVLERAIHLHGAMGFTWELPLHFTLREIRKIAVAFPIGAGQRGVGQNFIEAA
jgi:alkylation response protein AidB-like acyl-CoA dehydrogenase